MDSLAMYRVHIYREKILKMDPMGKGLGLPV